MSYNSPPPMGDNAYGAPAGGPHPEGTKLLILSIVGFLCCQLINIYVFMASSKVMKEGSHHDTSMVNIARIISIIGIVFLAIGIVSWIILLATGNADAAFNFETS